MSKITFVILFFLLFACSNDAVKRSTISKDSNAKNDVTGKDWKSAKGESIEFIYPDNWRMKIKTAKGTTQFGLTFDPDTNDIFYPVEIWEFKALDVTFDDFAAIPHQYFKKATGVKDARLMNLSKTSFKNFEAKKFEFEADGYPVNIIAVNGRKHYYMLVSYKEDKVDDIANKIFNSINISTP